MARFSQMEAEVFRQEAVKMATVASRRSRVPEEVVFVADRPGMRVNKFAYGLKQIGWRVILLHREAPDFDPSQHFVGVHRYANQWQALAIASSYSPAAYHLFSSWNFEVASTFIQCKPGKIVFETWDLANGMLKEDFAAGMKEGIKLERFCLENADGVSCRGLHTQYLKRNEGFKFRKRILFPDYCWAKPRQGMTQEKMSDGIHAVYLGNLQMDPNHPAGFTYRLAEQLSRNGVHFHIYPSFPNQATQLRTVMTEYFKGASVPELVHIHEKVPSDRLTEELSKYHFGIFVSSQTEGLRTDNDAYHPRFNEYVTANKVFDYIDAGLFVLAQNGRWLRRVIGQYGNGKTVKTMEDIVHLCKTEPLRHIPVPRGYTLQANVSRLASFYSSL
ncbi:MAG: hypothetical protein K9N62_02365 [Verrucomicrobia bacterium]|nr:hypothetical protein [Verrucomicrobiota bacterium]